MNSQQSNSHRSFPVCVCHTVKPRAALPVTPPPAGEGQGVGANQRIPTPTTVLMLIRSVRPCRSRGGGMRAVNAKLRRAQRRRGFTRKEAKNAKGFWRWLSLRAGRRAAKPSPQFPRLCLSYRKAPCCTPHDPSPSGGGVGGGGKPAHPNASNRIDAHPFCPPLQEQGRGADRPCDRLQPWIAVSYRKAPCCTPRYPSPAGGGARGGGKSAHPNANNRIDAHPFCPPLKEQG